MPFGFCTSKAIAHAVWQARSVAASFLSSGLRLPDGFGKKQSSLSVPVAAANIPARPSGILFAKTLPAIRHALQWVLIKVQMRLFAELGFITLKTA